MRFVLASRNPDSGVQDGVFRVAYALRSGREVNPDERKSLEDALSWFEENLATPERFNRTRSRGFYRRKARGIAWFRDTAQEHLVKMHQLRQVLERHGYGVELIREDRVGYVVYEDAVQVIAEPFSDTKTGAGR